MKSNDDKSKNQNKEIEIDNNNLNPEQKKERLMFILKGISFIAILGLFFFILSIIFTFT